MKEFVNTQNNNTTTNTNNFYSANLRTARSKHNKAISIINNISLPFTGPNLRSEVLSEDKLKVT